MLAEDENELLTRTAPGSPGGALLRCYWQPVALAEELPPGGAPLPVQVLGEELVLFRDDQDRPGLLGLHCSHRGADLSYGRVEAGGLRCLYHGWLYDAAGRCLEQPGEPADSTFGQRVRHPAYPCRETAGLIFAYLGPGDPPLLPAYEALTVPDAHRFVTKYYHECNYLQGNEGEIDPVHTSYLHRQMLGSEGERGYRGVAGAGVSQMSLYARDVAPRIEIEETDYGVRDYNLPGNGSRDRLPPNTNLLVPQLNPNPRQNRGQRH